MNRASELLSMDIKELLIRFDTKEGMVYYTIDKVEKVSSCVKVNTKEGKELLFGGSARVYLERRGQ